MLNVNEYFDGKVKSIGFPSAEGRCTVGVMVPGDYTFGTEQAEEMQVVSGALTVKLPEADEWETFNEGEAFYVPANSKFDLKVEVATAYLCKYL
ncbi:pyrimidine/purine nucleoside phosphorylase [Balneatrix alpica]|uniref:Pyrimidine/purine nucleoside phosphorylase n=1 Tax=Balneatrix alpica TaxID=75684 RepID=A0ABV5ZBA9_9GAMM|nr:pyrimidine/purine nucleoside phosphorylase [Balneatrix alpica]